MWLNQIIKDGLILPATGFLPPGVRPVVWFSTAPDWEPTACKNRVHEDGTVEFLDRAGTAEFYGLARISVLPETAPHDWRALKELTGMSNKLAQTLYRSAITMGSRPGNWWGTFEAVPRSKWISAQIYTNAQWLDVSFEKPLEPMEIHPSRATGPDGETV